MQKIRWFFLISAIVVALAMALQNNASTDIQLFFFKRSLPLSVLMLSTIAIGFLMGALTTILMLRRGKAAAKAKSSKAKSPKAQASSPAPTETDRSSGSSP